MAGKGGARENAGRKSKAEEFKTGELAREAITKKYGDLQKGLIAMLESGEPQLMKFVLEHAFGKPTEKLEHAGPDGGPIPVKWDITLNLK